MSKQTEAPADLEQVRTFVNTVDLESGEEQLAEPAQLAAWLTARGLADASLEVTPAQLARALAVREALRSVLLSNNGGEPPAAEVGATLDAAATRGKVRLRFEAHAATSLSAGADGVDGAMGRLLAIVHSARASGDWSRLKACREHNCAWAFYDHTKNRSGAWCNMEVCGNRAKARAYRERRARME